jgi:alkylhydroperoxidase family enzyme
VAAGSSARIRRWLWFAAALMPGGKLPRAETELVILRAVDELHADRRIGDELWAELARQLDEVRLVELCMLIGHYEMLAMTLNSLGVEPEHPQNRPAERA